MHNNPFLGFALWLTLISGIITTVYGWTHHEKEVPLKSPVYMDTYQLGRKTGRTLVTHKTVINWRGWLLLFLGLILLGLFCWLEWGPLNK